MNETVKMEAGRQLEAAVKKATEAAEKLLKCAESISNPTYSVSMQGCQGELEILAVRHFQGQIVIQVKSPFSDVEIRRKLLDANPAHLIEQDMPALSPVPRASLCDAVYPPDANALADCSRCGRSIALHKTSWKIPHVL